ncbi:hypothetical protein [Massilia alkalitolerans]
MPLVAPLHYYSFDEAAMALLRLLRRHGAGVIRPRRARAREKRDSRGALSAPPPPPCATSPRPSASRASTSRGYSD